MRLALTVAAVCVGLYVLCRPYFNPEGFVRYEESIRLQIETAYVMGGLLLIGLALVYFFMFSKS